jgi:Tfp pilus assembly protein PilO
MKKLKLSQEKIKQLVQITMVTAMALAGLWFFLIKHQLAAIDDLKIKKIAADANLTKVEATIKTRTQVDTELAALTIELSKQEEDMATGDLNSWLFSFLRKYKTGYRVDIPQYGTGEVGPMKMLPDFPYQQVAVSIAGAGFYHEIGKFISDFENTYPYARVFNLDLEPAATQTPGDKEKLSFRLGIAILVGPNTPRTTSTQ